MRRSACGLAFWILLVFSPANVRAGNEDELFVGNQASMVGGAISAVVKDASSTWYNPAGLGAVERDQVDVSATVYTLRLYHAPEFISAVSGESDDGKVTEFVVAPSQIAYVRRLSPGLSLGLGYFMPRSTNYVLRESLVVERGGARSDWQMAAAIAEAQHIGAAALGYSVSERVRIGASLIGGFLASTQSIALFGAASEAAMQVASQSNVAIGTRSRITGQIGLGLQLDLTGGLVLGLTVRTPEVMLHASADALSNETASSFADPASPVLRAAQRKTEISQGVALSKSTRTGISLAYRFARGWAAAEFDVQPKLERLEVQIRRRTTWNARAGVYYALAPSLALGAGVFTDRSPEASKWDFVGGNGDFYGGTLGLELSNEHLLAPTESVKSLVFTSVFALRYAFSSGAFGRMIVNPANIAAEIETAREMGPFRSVKGELNVHELGLFVGSGLRF